jgi:hypothetical protein
MQKFEIEIKNEKIKSYQVIALLIVGLNTLLFIFLLFTKDLRNGALVSLGFITLYTGYRFYISKKKNQSFFFDEWIFFLLMILWVNDSLVFASVNLVLFLLYTISLQPIIYDFETSLIKQRKFPWKKYQWSEFSNVIIKDALLTMDLKNNRIVQAEIMNQDISEDEFNAFAKQQLNA